MENFESLEKEILQKIISAENEDAVEKIRVEELGKKGRISKLLSEVGSVEPDERKIYSKNKNIKMGKKKKYYKKKYFKKTR